MSPDFTLEYFVANGLLRFRIPMLFIISGYLYAAYDQRPYLQQIKKVQNAYHSFFIMECCCLITNFHTTAIFLYRQNIVSTAKLDQLQDNRPYTEIGWRGMIQRWLSAPAYQLWFIVSLLFVI